MASADEAAMRTNLNLGTAATADASDFDPAGSAAAVSASLGNSAGLDVGTTPGTVAAGDDSRFTDARTPTGAAGGILSGNYPNPGYATGTQAFTDADHTKLDGIEAGADVTDATNVAAAGALMTSSLGTGVATALAIAIGSAGASVVNGGALGTPASGNLANCTFPTLNQSTTGNAATATALQTARTLNGTSFDGTANITVPRTGVVREVWIGAGAMTPRTTNGAAPATVEMATNDNTFDFLDFDTATEEGACFAISLPQAWNAGTVKAKVYWTAASGSGGVAWGLRATSYADDDALDAAYGTEQVVTDTLITADDCHITAATAAITIGGTPAGDDLLLFEITREVGNGSDTLAVDARLIGVKLQYTESATEPSAW